ncbi:RNA polymerase subunit sigma [Chryseotalea sanaruensis]|uniref:RNA polymerase subunit sigma n=1 Tax=Chryseotalea sanaruensis TaxID=2482724 RepID=A0A401U8S0_9BACT|nr:sigma-70 family RNA polymerase sigma factor [Chryseotalea sanaruensis]GCC51276.1 RNA polymerase subunit sigma [Chryseotalea sanaruensis]
MNHAQTISHYQPMLHAIAQNLVRCTADAEDIVQETFLKWLSIDQTKIENTKAYLIKAVTNNCLNHLNSLKKKKTEYLDAIHMPEFLHKAMEINFSKMDLDANLKAAFKVLNSKLEPLERAVFLLKEVFDFDYEAVQTTLNKKKDHCRQLLSRAKKKLNEERSKINFEMPDATQMMESFRRACDLNNASDFVLALKNDL